MRATSICGAIILAAVVVPELAAAQTSPTAPPSDSGQPVATSNQPSAENGDQLEEIIVTARRHEESLQSVPVAVTVLSGTDLEQKHLQDTSDLRDFIPSLNVGGQNRDDAQFFLRGQGPAAINAGQNNFTSVATYFAEAPAVISGPGVFFDLSNVQVLKGPQGTLFGRNTTGGAVLFTPAPPTQNLDGYLKLTYGNFNDREVEGVVNLPITDTLSVRVSGDVRKREGFTDNVITGQKLDDVDYGAWRVSVRWTPTSEIEDTLIVNGRNINQNGTSAVLRAVNPNAVLYPNFWPVAAANGGAVTAALANLPPAPLTVGGAGPSVLGFATSPFTFVKPALAANDISVFPNPALQNAMALQQAIGDRRVAFPYQLHDIQREYGLTNTTIWNVNDAVTLKNIFSAQRERVAETWDYTGMQVPIFVQITPPGNPWNSGKDQLTEEFQIQYKSTRFSWIGGIYYEYTVPGTQQVFDGITLGDLADTIRYVGYRDQSTAAFGHVDVNLNDLVPGLSLSGGMRYTEDQRLVTETVVNLNGMPSACPAFTTTCLFNANFNRLTGDISLNEKWTDSTMSYATLRTGYKSGGFNAPAPTPSQSAFSPETVTDTEIGLKSDWKIGSVPVRSNLAAYRDWYKDMQLIAAVSTPTDGIESVVINAPSASLYGGEAEITVLPLHNLQLSAFYSYTHAVYGNLNYDGVNVEGKQFDDVPHNKFGGSVRYTIAMGSIGSMVLGADESYQSHSSSPDRTAPPPVNEFPSYAILNLHADWNDVLGAPLDLSFFASNTLNKTYIVGGYPIYQSLGFTSALYGDPRMYGASLRYHFGQ